MSRLILGIAVLIGFISLVPKSAETACSMTPPQCYALHHGGSPFKKTLDSSMESRDLDPNEINDKTVKWALDMLFAKRASKESEEEETENMEMKKRKEEEEQRRSQYERIRQLLDKLLEE